jgi:hypothetical protein
VAHGRNRRHHCATACSLLASLEQPVITTFLALVRSDATHVPDDRELVIGNKILVGVTPAFRTQCIFLQLLIFLDVAGDSVTFCSRSFHPIRCDFIAVFWSENGAH